MTRWKDGERAEWQLEMWWGKDGEGSYLCRTRREAVEVMRETRQQMHADYPGEPLGWRVIRKVKHG